MDDTDIRALLLRDMDGRDRSWWLAQSSVPNRAAADGPRRAQDNWRSPMTDARAWLYDWERTTLEADRMRDALLAVLDECDRWDNEWAIVNWPVFGHLSPPTAPIRAAIDTALGISDCTCGHAWAKHGPEAPGCVECACVYVREGVRGGDE